MPEITEDYIQQLEIEKNYGMFAWFKKCMRNYGNFSGRARRREFWYFILMTSFIQMISSLIISIIVYFIVHNNESLFYGYVYYDVLEIKNIYEVFGIAVYMACLAGLVCSMILYLILLIPSFAVIVRRLHDVGRSGWWSLLIVLVYIVPNTDLFNFLVSLPICILFIIWECTDTIKQENQWGLPAK